MDKTGERGELRQVIRGFRGVFYPVGAFSFAINVLLLVPAIYMLQIYDRVLTSRNYGTLWAVSLIAAGLLVTALGVGGLRELKIDSAGTIPAAAWARPPA